MKTIAIINDKGGVAKTTTVTTVSHLLATEYGKRVLVVDMDPQSNTSNMFGEIDIIAILEAKIRKQPLVNKISSVEDLLLDSKYDISKCINPTKFKNLDIIPSLLTLAEAEERLKADIRTPQQTRLKKHLESVKDLYDYCIVDCSPSISILNINALACADEIYIPMRCDPYSCLGMCIVMELIETTQEFNPGLKIAGSFFTQWNGVKNVSKAAYELMHEYMGDLVLPLTIANSKLVEESSFVRKPLGDYEKNRKIANQSKTLKNYRDLTEYIISNNKQQFLKKYKKGVK